MEQNEILHAVQTEIFTIYFRNLLVSYSEQLPSSVAARPDLFTGLPEG